MAFPRLINTLDRWASDQGRDDVFAQVGPAEQPPQFIEWERFIDPDAYRRKMSEAELVVAHAGMGTIITALCLAKPIVIMPRRGDLRETRNDHQVATARRFGARTGVVVAMTEGELVDALERAHEVPAPVAIDATGSDSLLSAVRDFVLNEHRKPSDAGNVGGVVDARKTA